MAYEFDAPEDVGGQGSGLKEPGTYHLVVSEVHDGATHKGTAIEGFSVTLTVLEGTVKEQAEKTFHHSFFYPSTSDTDKQREGNLRRLSAFFIATNLITPAQLGQKGLRVDVSKAAGHQLVAEFDNWTKENGETKFGISYSNTWHVDMPTKPVQSCPKNTEALGIIPAEFRHEKDAAVYFEKVLGKRPASNGAAKTSAPQPLSSSDLDGL